MDIENIKEQIESLLGFIQYDDLLYYQGLGQVKDKGYILGISTTLFIEKKRSKKHPSLKEREFTVENNNFLLKIDNLKAHFYLDKGVLKAVDGVSSKIEREKILGLVEESGCGRSVTAQSILRIVPAPGKVEGQILLH